MIRFGIIGCGRIGIVHARGLAQTENAQLVAVSDYLDETAQKLAAQYGVRVQTSEQIINADDIDAIIIGTPTDTHLELIQTAAQAGKAIFCEKPVENTIENIQRCIDAVEAAGVPFMTGFNRRFDPNFANLQARVRAGEIGNVEMVNILSRDPSPPPLGYIKTSGGIFRDMTVHDFDMARFILGEDAVEIYAAGSALVDPQIGIAGDIDTAAVTLKTASGKICQISNSRRASYGYDQRVEVHGAKGMLRAGNVYENTVEMAGGDGFARAPLQNFFLERYEAAYRNELGHFTQALESGIAPTPSIRDGLQAQILAEAAQKSLDSGEVVRI